MKRLPELFPLLLVFALAGACEAPPAQDDGGMQADSPVEDVEPPPPFITITLSVEDGSIVVSPDSAEVPQGQIVRWEGAEANDVWVVVFADSTPMRNGRRVYNGDGTPADAQGPVDPEAAADQGYKYWVFYPTGEGEYLQVDPELWVIDDQD